MEQEPKQQSLIVLSIAIAALVGAVVGVVGYLVMTNAFGLPVAGTSAPVMDENEMDAKIVELIEEESATISVVDHVAPAVVNIVVKKPRGSLPSSTFSGNFFLMSPFLVGPELTEEQAKELVEVSSGTGFFVSEDGYLLTNRHVVEQTGATYFIVTNDGEEIEAQLVDVDPFQDVAILKVEGQSFPKVTLGDSDAIRIGQTVIAIGNTLSEFRNTVTKGVISGINRRVTAGNAMNAEVIEEAIQTDAAINPGNSGGPLINLLGQVIGINTAVSFQGESIAFAIPINQAKRAIDDVREHGRIVRPWLGVRYVLVMPDEQAEVNYEYDIGALVVSGDGPDEVAVFEGSPADNAGIREKDIIIAVDGENLSQDRALAEVISAFRPGDTIKIKVLREGVLFETDVELAEYSEE